MAKKVVTGKTTGTKQVGRAMKENKKIGARRGLLSRGILSAGAVLLLGWAVVPFVAGAQTDPAEPVELRIGVTHESLAPALTWLGAVKNIPGSTTARQISGGDAQSKERMITGGADIAVSGTPFTDAERKAFEATGRSVIEAPIQAVGMSFLVSGPRPTGIDLCGFVEQSIEDDPLNELPPDCLKVRDFEGPLRLTSENLADVFLESPVNNWQDPTFLSLLGEFQPGGLSMVSPLRPASAVLRSDAGMANLALGTYLRASQPTKWTDRSTSLFLNPEPAPDATWPFTRAPAKQGLPDAVGVIRQWKTASAAVDVPAESGAMTMTTPLAAAQAIQAEAEEPPFDATGEANLRTDLYVAQMKNGAGEWLSPTPAAISTSLAAGQGAPLFAATQNVPGGWPLSWANSIYAPDSGLTGVEANTVAAIIRWQSTVGRQRSAELSDGQLPDVLVAQALAAADKIVSSNCTAAGLKTVLTSDLARFAPSGSLADLGETLWCDTPLDGSAVVDEGPAVDPFTGAVVPVVAGVSASSGSTSGTSRPLSASSATPSSASATAGSADFSTESADTATGGIAATLPPVKVARIMPLPLPGSDPRFDRLATLALGGLMFLGVRALMRRSGLISA
ncbi:unannotated protein [freshwater metagenome]|uniref:Unannotated protein n=1 Tax=freshwater metagenome TaxID=449393 RepID=A0A6J7N1N1_9ZZZZ|nr:hypothetical protein [Actinomycetota bacterium]